MHLDLRSQQSGMELLLRCFGFRLMLVRGHRQPRRPNATGKAALSSVPILQLWLHSKVVNSTLQERP